MVKIRLLHVCSSLERPDTHLISTRDKIVNNNTVNEHVYPEEQSRTDKLIALPLSYEQDGALKL
jgi:hypothetical protein